MALYPRDINSKDFSEIAHAAFGGFARSIIFVHL